MYDFLQISQTFLRKASRLSPSMSDSKIFTVVLDCGTKFEIPETSTNQLLTIAGLVEDIGGIDEIPIMDVSAETFSKVLEWCARDDRDEEWMRGFFDISFESLLFIIKASMYLDVKSLQKAACKNTSVKMIIFSSGCRYEEFLEKENVKDRYETLSYETELTWAGLWEWYKDDEKGITKEELRRMLLI